MADQTTTPEPAERFVIEDIETLRVLADPQRMSLLLMIGEEPRTVKEMAAAHGVPQTRLYYHVRKLESHGLIRVARRRMVSGIEERTYEAIAKSWTVSPPLMSSAMVESGVLKACFDMTAAELELAFQLDDVPIGQPDSAVPAISFTRLHLSAEEVAEVQRRIHSIMDDFGQRERGPDTRDFHAYFGVYRTAT